MPNPENPGFFPVEIRKSILSLYSIEVDIASTETELRSEVSNPRLEPEMLRKGQVYTLATHEELAWLPYFLRLQLAVRNTGIGQRDWPTAIQDMFLRADMRGDRFRYACGKPFSIPLVDTVWGSERWVREFLTSTQSTHPDKERILDLFFRVEMPDIARHFGR